MLFIGSLERLICGGAFLAAMTIIISTLWWADSMWWASLGYVVIAGTACFPRHAVAIALVALPLGGNRPTTAHFLAAVVAGCGLIVGLGIRSLARSTVVRRVPPVVSLQSPLLLMALAYVVLSIISLLSLPPNHVFDELRNLIDGTSARALAGSIRLFLELSESAFLYSFLSVTLTIISFALGVEIYRLCRESVPAAAHYLLAAITVGLIISALVGLLDFFDILSLTPIRPLDPIVNPGGQQTRLQSLFAHSGWYAEYLTLALGSCLVFLTLQLAFRWRAGFIIITMLLGEIALILTYQRGGWVSYPLTLLALWAALYIARGIERGDPNALFALRRSLLKVTLSLPLTLVVSCSLVLLLSRETEITASPLQPYIQRAYEIARTSDRLDFVKAGALLGSQHPVAGGGADSFAWRYVEEFVSPRGEFYKRLDIPLYASAHNVYAQTFSGKGLLGLIALLLIPTTLIIDAVRRVRDPRTPLSELIVALSGACFGAAFLIYGNVQEIFYIQVLQYLFFLVVAITASCSVPVQPSRRTAAWVSWGLVVVGCVHLLWEYLFPGPAQASAVRPREFGCYAEEIGPDEERFRWCAARAVVEVLGAEGDAPHVLTIQNGPFAQRVTLTALSSEPGPQTTLQSTLAAGERRNVTLARPLKRGAFGRDFIKFEGESAFSPREVDHHNGDPRRLSFRLFTFTR